jgi:hypothetical protein
MKPNCDFFNAGEFIFVLSLTLLPSTPTPIHPPTPPPARQIQIQKNNLHVPVFTSVECEEFCCAVQLHSLLPQASVSCRHIDFTK